MRGGDPRALSIARGRDARAVPHLLQASEVAWFERKPGAARMSQLGRGLEGAHES